MEKNKVNVNSKILSKIKKQEIKADVIVPDSKPDIVSVISSSGIAYLNKENKSQEKIFLEGIVDLNVAYLSDIGDTRSLNLQINFSDLIEDKVITDKTRSKCETKIESLSVKVLNERKVSVDGIVSIKVDFYDNEELVFIEDIALGNECIIEKLKEDIETKSLVAFNSAKVSAKESLSSKQDKKILEIVKVNLEVINKENKISYNKVLTKADSKITIVYLTEECKIGKIEEVIPLMTFIDIDKITDSNLAETFYSLRSLNLKVNSQNETQILAQIEYEVKAEIYELKKVDVIQDMYAIDKNVSYTKRNVKVNTTSAEKTNEKYLISEKVSLDKNITNIFTMDCKPKVISTKNNMIEGEMEITIYYEADEKIGLNVKSIILPFIINNNSNNTNINDYSFDIVDKKVTINGENVDINIEYSLNYEDISWKDINVIENIEFSEIPIENNYKMYMYFVKPGDTIWNIAKKFKIKMEDLISINSLENSDKINVGDKIYIMK